MKVNVLKYGGHGVDMGLERSPKSWGGQHPGPDTVFWSEQKFHPNGDPAGGFNSFVCVADPKGMWETEEGERVSLISINGIGEIRWRIDAPHMVHYAEGSIEHFKLKEVKR